MKHTAQIKPEIALVSVYHGWEDKVRHVILKSITARYVTVEDRSYPENSVFRTMRFNRHSGIECGERRRGPFSPYEYLTRPSLKICDALWDARDVTSVRGYKKVTLN